MSQRKFNIQIPIESIPVDVTAAQKRILEEVIIDIYEAIGSILIDYDEKHVVDLLKDNVADHFQNLLELILEEKKYIIEVPYKESVVTFYVEELIEKYGYDKKEIISGINNLDFEEILSSKGTFVTSLLNDPWVVQVKGNQITVTNKLNRSAVSKDFNI